MLAWHPDCLWLASVCHGHVAVHSGVPQMDLSPATGPRGDCQGCATRNMATLLKGMLPGNGVETDVQNRTFSLSRWPCPTGKPVRFLDGDAFRTDQLPRGHSRLLTHSHQSTPGIHSPKQKPTKSLSSIAKPPAFWWCRLSSHNTKGKRGSQVYHGWETLLILFRAEVRSPRPHWAILAGACTTKFKLGL